MRNPGWNHEQVWSASCDVTFNGFDFGPNLQYGKLTFLPAENRKQQLKIAGMPGVYDNSKSPAGYPVPENMRGTLELFVLDPLAWQTPVYNQALGRLISPEGHFLSIVNSDSVRLDFINTNRMYMLADLKVTKYGRFDLGFNITLSIDAEPYWWEAEPATVEWDFQAPSVNLFDPSDITITPTLRSSCSYVTDPNEGGMFILTAPNGWYADDEIPDLDPTKTYYFYAKNVWSRGVYQLYGNNGARIFNEFTGVETLTLRLISRSAAQMEVGFADVCLYNVTGAGVASNEIITLDAPVRSILYTSNKFVTVTIGAQRLKLEPADGMEIFGFNVPPRSSVPVVINGESGCRGFISYQRGARSCTL